MFIISLDIRRIWDYKECETRPTYRVAAAEDYVSDLPSADLCVWNDSCVPTNFGPGGAGVLLYVTSARTQHHFPSSTVQFHPVSPQRSQSSIMPLDDPSNSQHLTFFRLVNTKCATEHSFSDAYGLGEFELAW